MTYYYTVDTINLIRKKKGENSPPICSMHINTPYCMVEDFSRQTWNDHATIGTGTAYPSGIPEFPFIFRGFRAARSLVLCVEFCISLLVPLIFLFCQSDQNLCGRTKQTLTSGAPKFTPIF